MTEATICARAATSGGTDLSLNLAEMLAPLIGSPGAPIVDEYCFLQSRFADENIFANRSHPGKMDGDIHSSC